MESETDPIQAPAPVRKRRPRKPKLGEPVFSETQEIESPFEPEPEVMELHETSAAELPAAALRGIRDHSMLLVVLALVLFLFSQAAELSQSAEGLRWQARNLDRQVEALTAAQKNLGAQVRQRQTLVDKSQSVTASYNELLNDLIRLAETDRDARVVVEKFQIKSAGESAEASQPKK